MSKMYREPINALDLALQPLDRIELRFKGVDGRWHLAPINRFKTSDPDELREVREVINEWAKDGRIKKFRIIVGDKVNEDQ